MVGKEQRQVDALRQFIVNALVMHLVLAKYPGITQLLTDLRYQVGVDKSPSLGELPLVTLSACLPSFRPADQLILTATRFSGVPAFIELIDVEMLDTLPDPLKQYLKKIMRLAHCQDLWERLLFYLILALSQPIVHRLRLAVLSPLTPHRTREPCGSSPPPSLMPQAVTQKRLPRRCRGAGKRKRCKRQ